MNSSVEGKILLLGDGDFSLSMALLRYNSPLQMTTTSLETDLSIQKHREAFANRDKLLNQGVKVYFGIDACQLKSYPEFREEQFHRIIFNFPHVGGKSNHKKNRKLLNDFFCSAVEVLHPKGQIIVTLCKGQGGTPADQPQRSWPDSWQVVSMAANAGLILSDIQPFSPKDFPGYFCTGFRSQDKWFHIDGALSHIFTLSDCMTVPEVTIFLTGLNLDVPSIYQERNLLKENGHPLCGLSKEIIERFTELSPFNVKELLPVSSQHNNDRVFHKADLVRRLLENLSLQSQELLITTAALLNDERIYLPIPITHNFLGVTKTTELSPLVEQVLKLLSHLDCPGIPEVEIQQLVSQPTNSSVNDFQKSHIFGYKTKDKFIEFGHFSEIDTGLDETQAGKKTILIQLDLDAILCTLCYIEDYRLLWSTEGRFLSQFNGFSHVCRFPFKPFSLFPMTYYHDISFWESSDQVFDETVFYRIIQKVTESTVKDVKLLDIFNDGVRTSRCYRLTFQSCDKALSYNTSWRLQSLLRLVIAKTMGIILR